MSYHELTPHQGNGYAKGMENQPEVPQQPEQQSGQAPLENNPLFQRLGEIIDKLDVIEGAPADIARQLASIMRPEGSEPIQSLNLPEALQKAREAQARPQTAQAKTGTKFVLELGQKMVDDIKNAEAKAGSKEAMARVDRELQDELGKGNVEQLIKDIEDAQRANDGDRVSRKTQELSSVLGKLTFKPEIKEFGYFDVPLNHEDLMEYIAASEDPKFQPGGEFPLFEKKMILDDYGNPILKRQGDNKSPEPIYEVTPIPRNFMRWLLEREDYFIGQNPFVEIKLFNDISVPSLNPITMGYIVNNPRFWISEKWVRQETAIRMTPEAYEQLSEEQKQSIKEVVAPDGSKIYLETDYVKKKEAPSWLRNLQDEVILSMFLTETEHNMDVLYFNDAMKSEKPLKELMEKICNSNFLTRFLPMMLHDASTSEYHNVIKKRGPKGEVRDRLDNDLDLPYQGALGKAQQRAMALMYHLAEANARANGAKIEQNPFDQMAMGMDDEGRYVSKSPLFYKSLIRQRIEKHFKNEVDGVSDLVKELNDTTIHGRKRYDWEKVDLVDLLFVEGDALRKELAKVGLTMQDVDEARKRIKDKYKEKPPVDVGARMSQLDAVGITGSKKHFLDSFIGTRKIGFDINVLGKKGDPEMKWNETTQQYEVKRDSKGPVLLKEDGIALKFYNVSGFDGADYFGVKFFTLGYDPKGVTPDANFYRNVKYDDSAAKEVRRAIADVIVHTERLDVFEAKYATERAFRRMRFMGGGARNDIDAIGHDAFSKVSNTLYYRLRQAMRAANFYGMEENLFGIRRLAVDMFEGINSKRKNETGFDRTLYELIMGVKETPEGVVFDLNKDIGDFEIHGNAMRQYFSDHLGNALSLYDLIAGPGGLDIVAKFMTKDSLNRWVVDHKAFKEFMDGFRKQATYTWDNPGLKYNKYVAGWTKTTSLAYDKEKGGFVTVQKVDYGVRKLKDLMFAERVQEMGMYKRADLGGIERGAEKTQMARNVLAYLISMQLKSHQHEGRAYWNAEAIEQIAEAFRKYGVGVLEMADEEAMFLRGLFTPEELRTILATAEIFLWAVYSRDYGQDAMGGLVAGIFEVFSSVMGQVGSGITLKAA